MSVLTRGQWYYTGCQHCSVSTLTERRYILYLEKNYAFWTPSFEPYRYILYKYALICFSAQQQLGMIGFAQDWGTVTSSVGGQLHNLINSLDSLWLVFSRLINSYNCAYCALWHSLIHSRLLRRWVLNPLVTTSLTTTTLFELFLYCIVFVLYLCSISLVSYIAGH